MSLRLFAAAACCIAALSLSALAIAAEPETGEVNAGKPQMKWTGEVTDPGGAYELSVWNFTGETAGTCEAPHCDTFTLKVAAGATALHIRMASENADNVAFEVEDPKGDVTLVDAQAVAPEREHTFESPAAGDWIVRAMGSPSDAETFQYET